MRRAIDDPPLRLALALLALGVLAGVCLRVDPDGELTLAGAQRPVPSLCPWRNLTGRSCPCCGLTRAVVSLLHGQVARSGCFHSLGPAILPVVALLISCWWLARRRGLHSTWRTGQAGSVCDHGAVAPTQRQKERR